MRLRLLVFAIAATSSFGFAQDLTCANQDGPTISYSDVKRDLDRVDNSGVVRICIYVKELDGTLIANPLRNVLMMELSRAGERFVLKKDIVVHQELQRRLSKDWRLSPYYDPTWIPVRGDIEAAAEDILELVVKSILMQPANQSNVTFRLIE